MALTADVKDELAKVEVGKTTVRAAELATILRFALGRNSVMFDRPDDFVRKEIAEALSLGIDVLPVLIGDTPLPQPHELPPDLRALSRHQFWQIRARDPEPDVDRLVESLAARPDLAAVATRPETTKPAPRGAGNSIRTGKVTAGRDVIFGDRNSGGRP